MAKKYTKELIHDTFVAMLNERPLKKITVKDLAIACEINRNAFYYYYSDIYELLSEIFENQLTKIMDNYSDTLSWEESFLEATSFALENKTAIYHVYDSMQQDELIRYIFKASGDIMTRYVEHESIKTSALEDDKKLVVSFYQCALTGMVLRWIQTGMKESPKDIVMRIGFLFDGNIETSLMRSHEELIDF
ncbi:MAG: TetR/AcrR family transcriptional regulator C-terminal domain-containing protein [Vagococcus sp.]